MPFWRRAAAPPQPDPPSPATAPERYAVLATALGGRRLDVVADAEFAHTDGETIHVTDRDPARTAVIVHALLVGHGSLARAVLTELRGKPRQTERYLLVETNRLCAPDGPWSPLRALIDVPEGVPQTADTAGSLELALGTAALPATPVGWGEIRPAMLLRKVDEGVDLEPGSAAPKELRPTDDMPELDEDESEDIGSILRALSSPLGSNAVSRMLQKLLGMGRSRRKGSDDGEAAGDQAEEARTMRAGAVGANARELSWRMASGGSLEAPAALGYRFPEWDVESGSYRPAWCTVIERSPDPALGPADPKLVTGRDNAMRRRLAKIGLSPEVLLRQPIGDDLDLDAAVRSQIAVASGGSPEENVYAASRPHRRELSVLVLLDVSGSTKDPSPAGGTVFDQQQDAAACLVDSLSALGARTACYAFHSQGRHAVHVLRVKTFDETWSQRAHERMASLQPGGYTRLGAAVRHGAAVLGREIASSRRLLLVLSDGFPYDSEYQDAYAEADSRRALAEARHDTIGCLCISIGAPTGDVALAKVFGSAAYANVPDLRSLRAVAPQLFVHGLKTSDPRRRISQRPVVG